MKGTEKIRSALPNLFDEFGIKSVLDAPCGDFNWMGSVIDETNIDYHGGDIVWDLVESNSSHSSNPRVKFSRINIISDDLPRADLWICRDCLFHSSFEDVYRTLSNFARSDIEYLLTTTHPNRNGFKNIDIVTGDAWVIDLHTEPFYLTNQYLRSIDDWEEPDTPKTMVLFKRSQIIEALPKMKMALDL